MDQARAGVANAEQGVSRAQAEWTYANNNLHRIEPLLANQFVTVDQVDRARTSELTQAQALKQAEITTAAGAGRLTVHASAAGALQSHAATKQGSARTGAERSHYS